MSNKQYDEFLEILAQLVEAKAKNPKEAAEIIRSAKIEKEKPVTKIEQNRVTS